MKINNIRNAIENHQFKVTDHAEEEAVEDDLVLDEILQSVREGKIIERYPDDFPFPSCLVFGKNEDKEAIHSVWGYNSSTEWAVLITVYRPDPEQWVNWERRNKNE